LQLKGCTTKDRADLQLQSAGGEMYFASTASLKVAELPQAQVMKKFVAKASLTGTNVTCGSEINIPGTLVTASAAGALLVDDISLIDYTIKTNEYNDASGNVVRHEWSELRTDRALVGLRMTDGKAVLADELLDKGVANLIEVNPGELVRVGQFASRRYRPMIGGETVGEAAFEFLSVDADGFIGKEKFAVDLKGGAESRLVGIERDPRDPDALLGVVRNGSLVQVLKWTPTAKRPIVQSLIPVNERSQRLQERDAVSTGGGYYYGGGDDYHFTPDLLSFEFPQGLVGITQVFLK
jgi:hypothetical protein